MKYEAVIGLEIHTELLTKTKMFSSAPLGYGERANSAINEVDLAMPGVLPSVNKQAVRYGVYLAKALGCEIDPILRFDRKHYFYSDLPKGYQITQDTHPLGKNGHFDIYVGDLKQTVRINRLHLEEDTAKQTHEDTKTLIDFNRAGTPLVEIVTEADFRDGKSAAAFVDGIRLLVIYLGVSDGKMAEGSLRCDVNISIRELGSHSFGTKVEIKNLNSISNVEKAIEYEFNRQVELVSQGKDVISETRRFDESSQTTQIMREKDGVVDYRYYRDANIPMTYIPLEILNDSHGETPVNRLDRFMNELGLSFYDANVLVRDKEISDYFDTMIKEGADAKVVTHWITQELLSSIHKKGQISLAEYLPQKHFMKFIELLNKKEISSRQAKEVFALMLGGKDPLKIVKESNMTQVSDEAIIIAWIEEAIAANPRAVEDHRKGLPSAQKFITGQVMRISKGQANPQFTNMLVVKMLDKAL
jgi:aspartyl-tRNA(Asn)/glutamyl-tRNA(Gln) amidotransferase subunit B